MIDSKPFKIWYGDLPKWNLTVEEDCEKGYKVRITGLENFFLHGSVHFYINGIMAKILHNPFFYINIKKDLYIFKAVLASNNREYIHNGRPISRIEVVNRDYIQKLGHPVTIAEQKIKNQKPFKNQQLVKNQQPLIKRYSISDFGLSSGILSSSSLYIPSSSQQMKRNKNKENVKKFKKKNIKKKSVFKTGDLNVRGNIKIQGNKFPTDIKMRNLNVGGDLEISCNNGINNTNIQNIDINGSLIMRGNN